jgi:uncharacterized protein YbjQ (UPF0145 family)
MPWWRSDGSMLVSTTDAIVGVDLDYEHLGGENRSMLMVSANGTAVKLS